MTDSANPYAPSTVADHALEPGGKAPRRSGGLLAITLFHATLEMMCFGISMLFAIGTITIEVRGRITSNGIFSILLVLALVSFFAILLYAEFRGFRPDRRKERITLLLLVVASSFPFLASARSFLIYWYRKGPQSLMEGSLAMGLGVFWLISIALRTRLMYRRQNPDTHVSRFGETFWDANESRSQKH